MTSSRAGNGRFDYVLSPLIAMKTILTCVSPGLRVADQSRWRRRRRSRKPVLIVDEATGEGSMTVQNTDTAPVLLYTTIENIAEDQEELVATRPWRGWRPVSPSWCASC